MSYTASYIVNSNSAQNTTDFTFTFPYIKEEHIEVYLDYSKITQGTGSAQYQVITNVSPKLIRLNTGIASANLRVEVRRNSSLGSPLVDYADGSTLTANDLDTSALQSLYIDQELKDNQGKTVSVDEDTGLPSMGESSAGNLRLTKVADPTAAQDAATKNYVDTKDVLQVTKAGDSMTGALAMGTNKVTGVGDPTAAQDVATKNYVDTKVFSSGQLSNVVVTTTNITDGTIVAGDLATGTLDGRYYTETELDAGQLDNRYYTETELNAGQLDNRYFTETELTGGALDGRYFTETEADARYFNISSGETIKDGDAFPDNDTTIATTAAINDRIIDLVDDVGGFVPIANETSFPTANPDVNNGTGTLVSIKEFASSHTPSGGTVTIANGAGSGNTVTITGCGSTVLTAGFGGIVETTSTLHTYTFHRLSPKATEVTTVAGISGNITTVAGIAANVTTVAGISANVTTVAGNNTNVTNVGGSIANVNTVATNLSGVNNFADRYRVASSAPGSNNDEGDLYFDTTSNELRVYNGSAWQGGVTATGNLAGLGTNTFTGAQTFIAGQTFDGRDVSVDGTKLDGIETGATADQTNAEIRTAVEAATDSNVFTDADHTKLDGIETAATADQTKSDIESLNINVNASNLNAGTIPDARFPATLPAASGANLTSLPAANLTGTLPAISGANLTNLPASGGAITATASGAIASGKGVLINANGTVSEPTLTTGSWTLNASPASSVSSYAGQNITSVGDGKFIMVWRNQSNGYLMMKYISVAADGSHTWGGDITVLSTSCYNGCVGWDPVNQLGIVGYRRQDYSYRAIFQTFSFSSNTITVNATTYYNSSVSSGNYSGIDITYGQDTNGVSGLMLTSYIPNPMYGNLQFAYNLQMSGTPFSVSGNLSLDSSNQVQYASTAYDPDTKQWCTAWQYISGSTYVAHARLSSVTGTTITGGSELTYESGGLNSQTPNIVYDEHANKFLVQYANSIASNSYNATYVKPLSVSGTSLSAGTRLTLPLNFQLRQMHMAYSPDIKKTVLHYQEYVSGSWNNGNSYRAEVTISGTSASCSTPTTLETISNSTIAYNPRIAFDSGTKRGVLIYGFPYTVKFGTYKSGSTNIRSTNFIGLSNAAYSNGATATINVLGGVSTVQSGLTAGTEYYVQNNGTLGTAADAYEIKAGIALSSSSLLIKGS
jgi:hypothetical protein